MDPNVAREFAPVFIGGTAGFIGGAVAALLRKTTVRQVLAAVLGGFGLGAFIAPAIVHQFALSFEMSGVVGFLGGLGVFGIVAGVERLADRFGESPESVLPASIRDRLPSPKPPPDHPAPQSPSGDAPK